jgi:hypothetical protein
MKRNSLMQLRNLMIAMTLASAFVLGACVMDAPESDEVTEQALESTESAPSQEILQSSQDGLQPEAICPRLWTCDFIGYFTTQSQCLAACGGEPCYRDYDCSGACTCP